MHLVERAPPRIRTTADGSSGSNRRNNDNPETQRASHRYRTLAIPIATQGSTQNVTTSMNPSSTLCMNRISVARHMLECANNIVNYLENPERVRFSFAIFAFYFIKNHMWLLGLK